MRAIILAAGMGTRLKPITLNLPKALVKVDNKPLIERQIEYLKEKGINDILIVVGYLKEKFLYLEEKYNVKIMVNPKYDIYNNIYTMYLVRDYLQDSYVIEGDVYLNNNFIDEKLTKSTYFTGVKENFKDEWILRFNKEEKVFNIDVGSGQGYIMSGVSYWSKEDGVFIKNQLEKVIEKGDFKNLYWDNVVRDNLNFVNIHIKKIKSKDWFEIDSLKDLEEAEALK
ncbi:CTP--phosphocholine cytidylyltransferase [Clostridium tetani]|uniref:CTP--phosphocholine cytidylyltransferase n=1 Tax=Clostridium tetani TaxID=1513 RepID=UPI000513AFFE|nr:CTP--phosphocholine cytidylyltransferase [Clostridium tetani]KGI43757.1 CTP:phosphocholine cytidylyltransferase [Clostridium tetani]RXI49662.1 CTP--phosphocholine cytidylyltransferase [Clostridium tetani]RXI51147.1 CTP--phosphocholine cytidylyltransferase [Clostridium tetani]RXM57066.1 CTP--phosphocholine cytidylyltransferase [Clostridium tetani]RXM68284.1 CTP--phosphocholine cytidylyltransferase [Clostridium tetani]